MRRSIMFLFLLLLLAPLPAYGFAMGAGTGVLATDPIGVAFFRIRSGGLLGSLLKVPLPPSVIAVGVTPRDSGFLDDHGLSSAFIGGGCWFDLDKEHPAKPTRRYVTAMLMAFPDDPDDGVNAGGAVTFGIQRATEFRPGVPGGYFAEAGAVACGEFVTILVQVGLFVGD